LCFEQEGIKFEAYSLQSLNKTIFKLCKLGILRTT